MKKLRNPFSEHTLGSLAEEMNTERRHLVDQMKANPTLAKLYEQIGTRKRLRTAEVELIYRVLDYNELLEEYLNKENNETKGNEKTEKQEVLPTSEVK